MLNFEWNPEKARANEQKHGVTFLEASEVFDDDHSSSVRDPDHSVDEDGYYVATVGERVGWDVVERYVRNQGKPREELRQLRLF